MKMTLEQLGDRYTKLIAKAPHLAPRCPSTDRPLEHQWGDWVFKPDGTASGYALDLVRWGGPEMIQARLLAALPVNFGMDNGGGCWAVRRMGEAARWFPSPLEALLVYFEEAHR